MPDISFEAVMWLVAFVVLLVIEGLTLSLISVWFAGGAVAALAASFFQLDFLFQAAAFVVVSGVLLFLMRPFAKKMLAGKKTPTNADRLVGEVGIVTRGIDPIAGEGQIKVMGQYWSAKPQDGTTVIPADSRVEVVGIAGVKAIVRSICAK